MPKHKKHKMMMPKHKTKMPLPSNFDHSFSNKRWKGIRSISHNPLSSTCSQPQQQFCNNNKLKLLVIHGDDIPSISLLSTEEEEEEKDETHTYCGPDFGRPVASCYELVLVVCDEFFRDEKLALYNPSTKITRTLPRPPRPPPSVEYEWSVGNYGLGIDPKSNDDDYKVIRNLEFRYEDGDNYHTAAGFIGYRAWELYSLKTDSWKRIPFPHGYDVTPINDDPIYINGFDYWVVPTGPENEDVAVLSFDFAKESFPSALIPGPPNEAYKLNGEYDFLLVEYEGSLALVVCGEHEKQQLELWVWNFDDRSWSRVGVWAVGVDVFYPLAFLKNHLFYFEEDSKRELAIFDTSTQKLKYKHDFCDVDFVSPFLTKTT